MICKSLSQERITEILDYDRNTGEFIWKSPTSKRVKKGAVCRCKDAYGYIVIRIDGRLYKAHRLAWLYVYGELPDGGIDHVNRIKDDNRIVNLRVAGQSQNMQNLSGLRGVRWDSDRKRWSACIKLNYKNIHLGRFEKLDDAVMARKQAEAKYFTHRAV